MNHTPAVDADGLDAFLNAPEAVQLAFVDRLPLTELAPLHDAYIAWADDWAARWREAHPDESVLAVPLPAALPMSVLTRMLVRLDPAEYLEAVQDADLREALTPAALARIRAESYAGKLSPLLTAPEEQRSAFVASLDIDALRSLDSLLQRYSQEHGRSPAWRHVHASVAARLNPT